MNKGFVSICLQLLPFFTFAQSSLPATRDSAGIIRGVMLIIVEWFIHSDGGLDHEILDLQYN